MKAEPTSATDPTPQFDEMFSEDELLERCFEDRTSSKARFVPVWKEAGEFWDMVAAESFTKDEKKALEDTKRPIIDPPFAAGVIETVVGAEMAQQVEPVFHGVDKEPEDEVLADWLTQLVRNGFGVTNADNVLVKAYHDMLISGYGFVDMHLDLHKIPFRVVPERLLFWNVWPDPDAVAENLIDANFWIVESMRRMEDAVGDWPDKEKELKEAGTSKSKAGVNPTAPAVDGRAARKASKSDSVLIVTYQYRRSVKRCRYVDPETQEEVDSTKEEYDSRKASINDAADQEEADYQSQLQAWNMLQQTPGMDQGAGPEPQQPNPPRIDPAYEQESVIFYNGYAYRQAKICGESRDRGSVLEDKEIDLPVPGQEPGFTIRCVTGYEWQRSDEQWIRRFGLMRKIYGIQFWFTKFIQSYLELMDRKVKGGGMVEQKCFEGIPGGYEKFVKMRSTPGWWQLIADGTSDGIHDNGPVQSEPGLMDGANFMRGLFGWISGVTSSLQGTMTQDVANVTVTNQQNQGLQMLLPIREPRMKFILSCGRLFAAICTKHLPAAELDKILGVQKVDGMTTQKNPQTGQEEPITRPDGTQVTAGLLLKAIDLLEYDCAVDQSLSTTAQKMQLFDLYTTHGLAQTFERVLQGARGSLIWVPEFLKNAPVGGVAAKKMAAEAEALFTQLAEQETSQGIMQAVQQMMQSDPQGAQQLLQQLASLGQPEDQGGQGAGQGGGPDGQGGQGGQAKPPSEQISFKDLPPAGKVQMAAQAGIQLGPHDVAQAPPAAAPTGLPPGP